MSEQTNSSRRRQLIEAAGRLFRASGFRAVTMEAIAGEAGVAKATLYSHFRDKAAVFAAVADHVVRLIAEAMESGLEGEGEVDERLVRALTARHKLAFELVEGSSHARELMNAKDSFARAPVEKVDARMIAAIAEALRDDRIFSASVDAIANTLFFGAVGVSGRARSPSDIEFEIRNFVRPYLAGLRALAERDDAGFAASNMVKGAPEKSRRTAGSGRK